MCGIAGFLGDGTRELLQAMNRALTHRGPDDAGEYHSSGVGLAMSRLAIVDRAGGRQPFLNETGDRCLVFNGEIYNHAELRRRYLSDMPMSGSSDTEVVLRLFERLGADSFGLLNGMFAFALWDGRKGQLWLVRDRLGIKPLYYHRGAHRLTFASELKALLQDIDIPKRLDATHLDAYLTWQYVPTPNTLIEGVFKLPPGHCLCLEGNRMADPVAYWSYEDWKAPVPTTTDLRPVLEAAVKRQLMGDVPVGAFLSGGVDSSLIVALMRQHQSAQLHTFTAAFPGSPGDESEWASRVAQHLGTTHTSVQLDVTALQALRSLVWSLDEPIADQAALPTYLLAREARKQVTVVLTGEGSDEIFGGYPRYAMERLARLWHRLPVPCRATVGQEIASWLPAGLRQPVKKIIASPAPDWERREAWLSSFRREERQRLLMDSLPEPDWGGLADGMRQQMRRDWQGWLVDDVLMKVDKTTMAASLEARVPYLDFEVVAWSFGLAFGSLGWLRQKPWVYEAARPLLPEAVLRRRKQAFAPPIAHWLREPLGRELVSELLGKTGLSAREWLDPNEIESIIAAHDRGAPNTQQIWSLMVLELWCQHYIDQVPFPISPF